MEVGMPVDQRVDTRRFRGSLRAIAIGAAAALSLLAAPVLAGAQSPTAAKPDNDITKRVQQEISINLP
ncbi:MAG TPA: hypothetical protein VME41_03575, partial [Stellaceae bacterium]|nr:hypothetical protein [Stellaceae bacterium]